MDANAAVANWTLLYSAELMAFSVVLLFLIRNETRSPATYWIASNITAATGMLTPSTFVETSSDLNASVLSFILSATSNTLAYFAVNYKRRTSTIFLSLYSAIAASWIVAGILPYGWLSLLIAYSGGSVLALLCAYAAWANPWWRGLRGRRLLIVGFLVCAALIMWRGLIAYMHRAGDGFLVDAEDSALGMRMLVFTSMLLQMSFLSVVISRDFRRRRIMDRTAAREFEINRAVTEEQEQIEALADERLDMINLLTHEVRQPINNAQAALEALDLELRDAGTVADETRSAVGRAQTVLDDITLSISNAIVGASMIDENYTIQTNFIDAAEIAALALSDCPAEQRHRIQIHSPSNEIYADLDPILVRLALRNLFDNALKYSDPQSAVSLQICHDEERFGISFKVTNRTKENPNLTPDIFMHRVRGNSRTVGGSGHGLFLVKKIADAHHGSISFEVIDDCTVAFDLFLPM